MYASGATCIAALCLLWLQIAAIRFFIANQRDELRGTHLSAEKFLVFSIAALILSSVFCALILGGASGFIDIVGRFGFGVALALALLLAAISGVHSIASLTGILLIRPWEFYPFQPLLSFAPRLFALIALVMMLKEAFSSGVLLRSNFKAVAIFFLFVGWLAFSSLFSSTAASSLSYTIERFGPIAVIFVLILQSVRDTRELDFLIHILKLAVFGVICAALVNTHLEVGPGSALAGGRLMGGDLLGNSNDLAALICIALPFALSFFYKPLGGRSNIFMQITLAVLFCIGLWSSQSRGALLSIGTATLVAIFLKRKIRFRTILFALLGISTILLVYFGIDRDLGEMSASSESRWNYIIAGFRMLKANPVFGVGVGNYPLFYEQFTPNFLEWGQRTAHSSWVLVMSESGLPGLLLFVLLSLYVLYRAFGIRNSYPELTLATVAYMIAFSFLSHSYLFIPYILFSLVIVAGRIVDTSGESHQTTNAFEASRAYRGSAIALLLICFISVFATVKESMADVKLARGIDKPNGSYLPRLHKDITLYSSRDELVSFMIFADETEGCVPPQVIAHEKLLETEVFHLPPYYVRQPSYTGAPLGSHFDPAVSVDFAPPQCTHGRGNWYLVEINVPAQVLSGSYALSVAVGSSKAQVTLIVWPLVQPSKPVIPFYSEISTWFNLLGHYGKWADGEGELAELYIREMQQHRLYPLTAHVANPSIISKSGKVELDLKTSPTPEQSFYRVNLKNRPVWAYIGFPTIPKEEVGNLKNIEYFQALENTLRVNDWQQRGMIYLWDEPQEEEMGKLKMLARRVRKLTPSAQIMVTTPYREDLKDLVDIFVPVMDQYDEQHWAKREAYLETKKRGGEVWWYSSCMAHGCWALSDSGVPDLVIDRPSAYIRSIGWLSLLYEMDAFLYYSVNHGYQHYPKRDPWESLWDFSGHGDGTLFYPGRKGERGFKKEFAIPSLRLKLLREASYDLFYLQKMLSLKDKPSWFEKDLSSLISSKRTWSRDYKRYENFRIKIGNFLSTQISQQSK